MAYRNLMTPQYGAKGDGIADDSPALLAALTNADGCTVYLPGGTYRLVKPITIVSSDFRLLGDGPGQTTLVIDQPVSSAPIGITIKGTQALPLSNVCLADFGIRGASNTDAAPYDLINVQDYASWTCFDCLDLSWARHAGLRWSYSVPGVGARVSRCVFHDISTPQMTGSTTMKGGALAGNVSDMDIVDTRVLRVGNYEQFHGLYIGASGGTSTGIRFRNCTLDGQYANLSLHGATLIDVLVHDNVIRSGRPTDFWATSNSRFANNIIDGGGLSVYGNNLDLSGNIITNGAFTQIYCVGQSAKVRVAGNTLLGAPGTAGIDTGAGANGVPFGTGWQIVGNTINGQGQGCVILRAGSGYFLTGNNLRAALPSNFAIQDLTGPGGKNVITGNQVEQGLLPVGAS